MPIIEQYGVRITDRVTIEHDTANRRFLAYFDGECVGVSFSGAGAVRSAQAWLRERQLRREAEARAEEEEARHQQRDEDDAFLRQLGADLGCGERALVRLIEIANRRSDEQETGS